jgi:regulator of telomere elongation helicase 1
MGARNIILTSGTLSPLDSFSIELGIPFDVKLQNDHVISKSFIISKIPKKIY